MIRIVSIEFQGENIQRFLQTKNEYSDDTYRRGGSVISAIEAVHDNDSSTVLRSDRRRLLIKLIKARSWHEHVKIFWQRSRTHKEYKGAFMLRSIGVRTPELYEMGISFPWRAGAKYIGYYVMEDLSFRNLKALSSLEPDADNTELRRVILGNIVNGYQKMRETLVLYSDPNLDNVFYSPDNGEITFIDTGTKKYRNEEKFRLQFNRALRGFYNRNERYFPDEASKKSYLDLEF